MRPVLLYLALFLPACAVDGAYITPSAPPGELYTFADGGCWADGTSYPACPWYAGSTYGYYYRNGGSYYWQPRAAWSYRPSYGYPHAYARGPYMPRAPMWNRGFAPGYRQAPSPGYRMPGGFARPPSGGFHGGFRGGRR